MSYCSDKGIPHSKWLSWDPVDRSKTIAYLLEQADICQLCGTAEWEWKESRFAYQAVERLCHGCYLKEVTSETAGKMPGTSIELIPVTEQSKAKDQLMAERRRKFQREED